MNSRDVCRAAGLLCLMVSLTMTADASYAGDRPPSTSFHEMINGGYHYTTGNSTYGGALGAGERYDAQIRMNLTQGARIRYGMLYVYWTWSRNGDRAIYPTCLVSAGGESRKLELVARYYDSKGFASRNDYFCGMDSYRLPAFLSSDGPVTVSVVNAATDNSSFVVQGIGALAVYEDPQAPLTEIWVLDGCDLLYSSYGITPEMATSAVTFNGTVAIGKVTTARLLLVAPSGGYSRDDVPEKNRLIVNRIVGGRMPPLFKELLKILFPRNEGKEWTDLFTADQEHQIGIAELEIGPYLRVSDNMVEVRDNGDYLELTNAILSIRYGPGT